MNHHGRTYLFASTVLAAAFLTPVPSPAALAPVSRAVRIAEDLSGNPLWYPSYYGQSVVSLGDIDGNGTSDLAVGLPFDDEGGPDRGALTVLRLGADGLPIATTRTSGASGPLAGSLDDEDRFAASIAAIGDVDGDGIPDLAAGAIGDDDGNTDAGALWIVTLTAAGAAKTVHKLSAAAPGLAPVLEEFDAFGSAAAAVGDIDGNGFVDLAVGAKGSDVVQFNGGAVWILRMGPGFSVVSAHRAGDDDSALDDALASRQALGGFLSRRGPQLLATGAGDGTASQPPPRSWVFGLDEEGHVSDLREQDTSSPAPQGLADYGDFDFDGASDLLAARGSGFDLLLLDDGGEFLGEKSYRGYPGDLPWGMTLAVACRTDDFDDNGLADVVVHHPQAGNLWLVQIRGVSADGASCGDPDGDGNVTASDALHVLRTTVGLAYCERLWCDVDLSGHVRASDALVVLRRAVQSVSMLSCPTTTTSSTVTSSTFVDECFDDIDCADREIEKQCCGHRCCECDDDGHCPDGFVCSGEVCLLEP